jgi:HK97 gp10 family phage protein
MKYDIKLEGFKELDAALSKLPANVAKRVLQRSVTGAMRLARKDVKAAAPVGEVQSENSQKYGRLSKNINVGRAKNRDKSAKSAYISTGKSFWGYFLEKGTKYIPAKPWFVPAFERASNAVLSELKKRLGEGIDKELKGLKK